MRRANGSDQGCARFDISKSPERSEIISGVGLVAERGCCQELARLSRENFDECDRVIGIERMLLPKALAYKYSLAHSEPATV